MSDCLFCKIAAGEIPAKIVYENENVLAFNDVNPQAPFHILIIPKVHIATINDIDKSNSSVVSELYLAAKLIAKENGFAQEGYRVVMNCNKLAGQTVYHIHLHMLAQRALSWPPG